MAWDVGTDPQTLTIADAIAQLIANDIAIAANHTLTPLSNSVGLTITNAGTGDGILIDQNGNGIALNIDSESTGLALGITSNIGNDTASFRVMHQAVPAFAVEANTDLDDNVNIKLGEHYLWVDTNDDLRISATRPTSDTGGTIVGTQS